MADGGNMERYTNPDAVETKVSKLSKLEDKTDLLLDTTAAAGKDVEKSAEGLKKELDDLSRTLTPVELDAFRDRLDRVAKKVGDVLDDKALNTSFPPLFQNVYSFNPETRALYVQGTPMIVFSEREMPVTFQKNPSSTNLMVEYKDERTGKRTTTEFSHEFDSSGQITQVKNAEFDIDNTVQPLSPTDRFKKEIAAFKWTGDFGADLTEINRLYKEISAFKQNDPSLIGLKEKYKELAQRYSGEMKKLPPVEKAELKRREAYLDLVYLDTQLISMSGHLSFSDEADFRDFLDKGTESFKHYEESYKLFKTVDSDFAREQMGKIIGAVRILGRKMEQELFYLGQREMTASQIDTNGDLQKLKSRISTFLSGL